MSERKLETDFHCMTDSVLLTQWVANADGSVTVKGAINLARNDDAGSWGREICVRLSPDDAESKKWARARAILEEDTSR